MIKMWQQGLVRSALLLISTAEVLWCQADRGSIRGTVIDPSGGIVAAARVTALNVQTGTQTETVSTDNGNYNVGALPPSTYQITAEKPGFKKLIRDGLLVTAGAVVAVDLRLELGETVETVQVTAQAPQLQKETSNVQTTVPPSAFADLPIALGGGRSPASFAVLTPGTKTQPPGQFGGFFATTFNGGQTLSGEIEVDGMSVNFPPAQGQPDSVNAIAPEAVQEMAVESAGASAEYKGGAGTERSLSVRARTASMATCMNSFGTTIWMRGRSFPRRAPSNTGTNTAAAWEARSGFPSYTKERTALFSLSMPRAFIFGRYHRRS
jgi:hypothetical protein